MNPVSKVPIGIITKANQKLGDLNIIRNNLHASAPSDTYCQACYEKTLELPLPKDLTFSYTL